jgi:hypothetical protein
MVYDHSTSTSDPLALVVAQVATGKSGARLIKLREHIIAEDAASASFTVTSAPKITTTPNTSTGGGVSGGAPVPQEPAPSAGTVKAIAYNLLSSYGFATSQFSCLDDLWTQESGWNVYAENASGAYGIPQALPGSKMASAGPDWESNATTQIKWGLGYIKTEYGTPCGAWDHEEAYGWY